MPTTAWTHLAEGEYRIANPLTTGVRCSDIKFVFRNFRYPASAPPVEWHHESERADSGTVREVSAVSAKPSTVSRYESLDNCVEATAQHADLGARSSPLVR